MPQTHRVGIFDPGQVRTFSVGLARGTDFLLSPEVLVDKHGCRNAVHPLSHGITELENTSTSPLSLETRSKASNAAIPTPGTGKRYGVG